MKRKKVLQWIHEAKVEASADFAEEKKDTTSVSHETSYCDGKWTTI